MEIKFGPRGTLQIDNAAIIFRNFAGREGQYNRKGERSFSVIIPTEEMKDMLVEDINRYGVGWNVRIRPPRNADEAPFMHLPVKINFNDLGPKVYLRSGNNTVELDEESVACLDDVEIQSVDMDIRSYDSMVNGVAYRTAYLKAIRVNQEVNRFAESNGGFRDDF